MINRIKTQEVLFSKEVIAKAVDGVADKIKADYGDKDIVFVCVLKGAVMFFTDLVRKFNAPNISIDFVTISSYQDATKSSGKVKLLSELALNVEGKNVIIVEDIVDSGNTIKFLREHFAKKNVASLSVACLLNRTKANTCEIEYSAIVLEGDAFVIGYGLDCAQRCRNYDQIYSIALKDDEEV